MSYVFTQKWRRDRLSGMDGYKLRLQNKITETWRRDRLAGLGVDDFIGPDQPWTAQTASTWITERSRQCESGKEIVIGGKAPPSYTTDGKKVLVDQCYATGRVKESSKPGYQRVQEWCCVVNRPTVPMTRNLTQAEEDANSNICNDKPLVLPNGQSFLTIPKYWLHKSKTPPTALCLASGVMDGDYRLLCCKEDMSMSSEALKSATSGSGGSARVELSAQQVEQIAQQQAEQAARVETVLLQAQEPEYGIWERYKWVFILGGGAIGVGFVAGLLKMALKNK